MAVSTIDPNGLNIGQYGNRNLIINGAMQVAQRGTGPATGDDGYYTVDRIRVAASSTGTTIETSQSTDAPVGFKNSFLYQIKSPNLTVLNSSSIVYNIEGQDVAHLEWGTSNAKTITLSFYVKCSKVLSSLGGSITNSAFNMTYPFDYAITAADTWEYKTITIEGPTSGTWLDNNNTGVQLHFNLGSQSSRLATAGVWANTVARGPTGAGNITQTDEATFQITGVQLEVGDTATPFEHRSYGQELALCQRYYFSINAGGHPSPTDSAYTRYDGVQQNANEFNWYPQYPVPMRATPSLIKNNLSSSTIQVFNATTQSSPTFTDMVNAEGGRLSGQIRVQTSGTIGNGHVGSWRWANVPNASVGFDAEL